jgi:hypothetical protein
MTNPTKISFPELHGGMGPDPVGRERLSLVLSASTDENSESDFVDAGGITPAQVVTGEV